MEKDRVRKIMLCSIIQYMLAGSATISRIKQQKELHILQYRTAHKINFESETCSIKLVSTLEFLYCYTMIAFSLTGGAICLFFPTLCYTCYFCHAFEQFPVLAAD